MNVGGRRCALSATELLSQSLPNLTCSISGERRQEMVNFITTWEGVLALGRDQISQ